MSAWTGIGIAFAIVGGVIALISIVFSFFIAVPGMPIKSIVNQLQFIAVLATFSCIPPGFRDFADDFRWALARFDYFDKVATVSSDLNSNDFVERSADPEGTDFVIGIIFFGCAMAVVLCIQFVVYIVRVGSDNRTFLESVRLVWPHYVLVVMYFFYLPMANAAAQLLFLPTVGTEQQFKTIFTWRVLALVFLCVVTFGYLLYTTLTILILYPWGRNTKYRDFPLRHRDRERLGWFRSYNVAQGEYVKHGTYCDLTLRYGSMFEAYKPYAYWWQIVMNLKILALAFVAAVPTVGHRTTCIGLIGFLLGLFVAYAIAYAIYKPMLGENGIQTWVHVLECVALLLILIWNCNEDGQNTDGIASALVAILSVAILLLGFKLIMSFYPIFMANRRRNMRREFARMRGDVDVEAELLKLRQNLDADFGTEPKKIGFIDRALQKLEKVKPEPPGIDVFGKAMAKDEIGAPLRGLTYSGRLFNETEEEFFEKYPHLAWQIPKMEAEREKRLEAETKVLPDGRTIDEAIAEWKERFSEKKREDAAAGINDNEHDGLDYEDFDSDGDGEEYDDGLGKKSGGDRRDRDRNSYRPSPPGSPGAYYTDVHQVRYPSTPMSHPQSHYYPADRVAPYFVGDAAVNYRYVDSPTPIHSPRFRNSGAPYIYNDPNAKFYW